MIDREQAQKAIDDRRVKRRDRELNDLQVVLKTVQGRRLVWRLLEKTGFFADSFHENPHRTSYNEGQRSIGSFLMQELRAAAPDAFGQMQRESVSEQTTDAQWLEKITKESQED